MKSHKGMSLKQVLKMAGKTYKKKGGALSPLPLKGGRRRRGGEEAVEEEMPMVEEKKMGGRRTRRKTRRSRK